MTKTIRTAPSWLCIRNGIRMGTTARLSVKRMQMSITEKLRDWEYVRFIHRLGWCSVGLAETRWQQKFLFWTCDGIPTGFHHYQRATYTPLRRWLCLTATLPDTSSSAFLLYKRHWKFSPASIRRLTGAQNCEGMKTAANNHAVLRPSYLRIAGVHLLLDHRIHCYLLSISRPCTTILIRLVGIHTMALSKRNIALIAMSSLCSLRANLLLKINFVEMEVETLAWGNTTASRHLRFCAVNTMNSAVACNDDAPRRYGCSECGGARFDLVEHLWSSAIPGGNIYIVLKIELVSDSPGSQGWFLLISYSTVYRRYISLSQISWGDFFWDNLLVK